MAQTPNPSLGLSPILEDINQLNKNPDLVTHLSSAIGIKPIPTGTSPSNLVSEPSVPESPDQATCLAQDLVELDKQLKNRAEELEVKDVGGRLEKTGKVLDELLRILEHVSVVG